MRKFQRMVVAAMIGLALAPPAFSQGRPPGQPGPDQGQYQRQDRDGRGFDRGSRSGGQYYYNNRWVDQNEWERHSAERDRWARNHQRRRSDRRDDNSSALIAGIIGFALGAAIIGSQQQAERARSGDESFDTYCARKYRSYDRRSRTYMGFDGARHYCQ